RNSVLIALLVSLSISCLPSDGANILGVFTSHSPSHLIVHMSVMKALAEEGHNVTVVSSLEPKVTHKSIKHIVIPMSKEDEKTLNKNMGDMTREKQSLFSTIKNLFGSFSMLIYKQLDVLEDKRFTELYTNKDNKFDAVVVGFFFNRYQVGLGSLFKCPIILSWTSGPMDHINELMGNPVLISTVPNMNMPSDGKPMNFKQRMTNFASTMVFPLFIYIFIYKFFFCSRMWGKIPHMLSFEEAKKNVSLLFCNSHALSEGPLRPNVPAVVEIGGIQIKQKPDPLPQDIKEFLDGAKDGAILFSLGSNLKGDHIKPEIISNIFKTLSSLKQRIIWKWEDVKHTPGKAANILYKDWLPQDDILAHPKIKLFITHAGKGGMAEAQYHAVPMLALPVFADQPANAEKLAEAGYGLALDLTNLEADALKEAIKELLVNPKYTAKLKQFSQLYRDRPMTARDSVVYWTDYVVRYKGAVHMQSTLVHMNWLTSSNLDVYLILAVILVIVLKITKIVLKFFWRKCCGGKGKAEQSKQKS
ncbi:Ugt36Ba, partial [Drosophila busckii]